MNLNAIKTLCHGGKRARIHNCPADNGQWIGNGMAAWPVEDIYIDGAGSLMTLWNLSDKARSKAIIFVERQEDTRYAREPIEGEEPLDELGAVTVEDDASFICLRSRKGALWINAAYLKPVRADYRNYGARWDGGSVLIAVYDDLSHVAALVEPESDPLSQSLRRMAQNMTADIFQPAEAHEEEKAP